MIRVNKTQKKYFEYENIPDWRVQKAVSILEPVECEEISRQALCVRTYLCLSCFGINSGAGIEFEGEMEFIKNMKQWQFRWE